MLILDKSKGGEHRQSSAYQFIRQKQVQSETAEKNVTVPITFRKCRAQMQKKYMANT
jgi:hypothetical protein